MPARLKIEASPCRRHRQDVPLAPMIEAREFGDLAEKTAGLGLDMALEDGRWIETFGPDLLAGGTGHFQENFGGGIEFAEGLLDGVEMLRAGSATGSGREVRA